MKQTFNIPEGCKVVTVEQIGNQLITSFEPEKYVPKAGDCVKRISEFGNIYIGEYDGCRELYNCIDVQEKRIKSRMIMLVKQGSFHKITPEELQAEFEKLGYVYDFETHTASKKRWRAKKGCEYFFFSNLLEIYTDKDIYANLDDQRYDVGNYFQTKSDAERFYEIIKKEAINFHKNNQ